MSLHENQAQLTRAFKDLMVRWERTRDVWRDDRARQFQEQVLRPLEKEVKQASNAMDRMNGKLRTARARCSVPQD